MGIVERIAQLLLANINDLLDQAEDPEKMLNQYLREMESQRRQARESLVEMIAQEKLLEADWIEHDRRSAKWGAIAEKAVRTGKDDLALESLRRKRSDQELATLYESQFASQRRAVTQMKAQMNALDAKYERTSGQRDLLIARQRRARAEQTFARKASAFVLPDFDAEFERIELKIRSHEAQSIAIAEVAFNSIGAQLQSFEADLEVEQELALLKGQLGSAAALSANSLPGL